MLFPAFEGKDKEYLAQLTEKERKKLRGELRKPEVDLDELAPRCPKWREGRWAGMEVDPGILLMIRSKIRREGLLRKMRQTATVFNACLEKIKAEPALAQTSGGQLDAICSMLAQDVMFALANEENMTKRVPMMHILVRREDQLLSQARFHRETCKKFMDWYENADARGILEGPASNAEKLKELGKLLYGEEL